MRKTTLALATLLAVSAALPSRTGAQLDPLQASREERVAYAMGMLHARELRDLHLTREEFDLYAEGLVEGFGGTAKLRLNDWLGAALEERRGREAARRRLEETATERFLAFAAAEAGAETLPSGAILTRLKEGSGGSPGAGSTVLIHYHGTLRDGLVVDSSLERGEPRVVELAKTLACWRDGLVHMRVGERAKLVCPPALAYGDDPPGALVPPGAVLTFEMELLAIR